MKSPSDMSIIQVDVTNHCFHHCSNCTRFCGLHKSKYMMDMDSFTAAVDSLSGYRGIVGIMGGEPTMHPRFSDMSSYLKAARPQGRKARLLKAPVTDFNAFQKENWNSFLQVHRGVWSALGETYYKNLEIISDVFPYQCLNDHKNMGLHQALLLPRRELGIPDDVWYPLRDKCWIQNEWSACITPKGAFFCEIAGALDWLLEGPGGWPVEPGWWKRKPEDFGDQLRWCELCSAPLAVPRIPGNAEVDIMSPGIWERLKDRKDWKITHGRCQVFDVAGYDASKYDVNYGAIPYLGEADQRVEMDTSLALFPHEIAVLRRRSDMCLPSHACYRPIDEDAAVKLDFKDWLLILNDDLPESTAAFLPKAIFNPGVLYTTPGQSFVFLNRRALALEGVSQLPSFKDLKNLYEKRKLYVWRHYRTPSRMTLSRRLSRLLHHMEESLRYRCPWLFNA